MKSLFKKSILIIFIVTTLFINQNAIAKSQTTAKRIVFIGNSYTEFHFFKDGKKISFNDLPKLFNLAVPKSIVDSDIQYGKTLIETQTQEKIDFLISQNPSVVVLQEGRHQKKAPFFKIKNHFQNLLKKFDESHIQVIYIKRIVNFLTPNEHKVFDFQSDSCQKSPSCKVIDVTPYFSEISSIRLLGNDGIHPRPLLTWLNSYEIAKTLDLKSSAFLSPKVLQFLKKLNQDQVRFAKELDQSAYLKKRFLQPILNKDNKKKFKWKSLDSLKIAYHQKDLRYIKSIAKNINKAFRDLRNMFSIDTKSEIIIFIAKDRKEFDHLVNQQQGYYFHKHPSRKSLIAVTSGNTMVFLSPHAYKMDSNYEYNSKTFSMLVYHELVHLIHFQQNAAFEFCPKYIGEGLPVYLSQQHKYLDEFREPVLNAIQTNSIPSINQISKNSKLSYTWGWTIVKFIDQNYEKNTLQKIAKHSHKKNIFKLLNTSPESFEAQWKTWLKNKFN